MSPKFNFYEAELPCGPSRHDITFKRNISNSQIELKSNLDFFIIISGKTLKGFSIEEDILNISSLIILFYGKAVCHSLSFLPKHPQTFS